MITTLAGTLDGQRIAIKLPQSLNLRKGARKLLEQHIVDLIDRQRAEITSLRATLYAAQRDMHEIGEEARRLTHENADLRRLAELQQRRIDEMEAR